MLCFCESNDGDDNGMLKMVFILVIWRFCVTSMIWVLAFV